MAGETTLPLFCFPLNQDTKKNLAKNVTLKAHEYHLNLP